MSMGKIGVVFGKDGGTIWADGEPEVSLVDTGTGVMLRRASLVAAGEPWANVLAGACDGLGVPKPSWLTPNDNAAPRVLGYARALLVARQHGHARACEILGEDLAALLRHWTAAA